MDFDFEKNHLAPCITEYVFPDKFNEIFVNLINDLPANLWRPGEIAKNNYNNNIRICEIFFVSVHAKSNKMLSKFDNMIFHFFKKAILDYTDNNHIFLKKDEGYHIIKYNKGGKYEKHIDGGGMYQSRQVSGLIYINDDYTGGELEFTKFDLKIKPKKNSILLFPSNYAYEHIAHQVTDGTKFCIVTWFHSI